MRFTLMLSFLLAAPALGRAQLVPAGAPITDAECVAASNALASGARDGAGWGRLPECGRLGANSIARALRAARLETDTIYLRNLQSAVLGSRDTSVFKAGLALSKDVSATIDARVLGFLTLLAQHDNGLTFSLRLSWADLVGVPRGIDCGLVAITESLYLWNGPLPGGYLDDMVEATEAAMYNAGTPQVARDIAGCARNAILEEAPEVVSVTKIGLGYVCGNTFRVTNSSPKWIDVTYRVDATTETGDMSVAPNGARDFFTHATGRVLLFYRGTQIRQRANGGTECR